MKFKIINESYEVRPLTEANLNRIAKGHEKDGYAILSASRGKNSEEENNRRTKELRDKLFKKRYSFIPVYGGYKEYGQPKASMEKSFVVFPYDIVNRTYTDFSKFKEDIIELATPSKNNSSYTVDDDQDSILICEPGGKPHFIPLKGGVDVDDKEFTDIKYNDTNSMFFTAIKKWNDSSLNRKNRSWEDGNPQRFTFMTECYIDNPPSSIQVGHSRWNRLDMNHIYKEN